MEPGADVLGSRVGDGWTEVGRRWKHVTGVGAVDGAGSRRLYGDNTFRPADPVTKAGPGAARRGPGSEDVKAGGTGPGTNLGIGRKNFWLRIVTVPDGKCTK